jgi:hypothetical protein
MASFHWPHRLANALNQFRFTSFCHRRVFDPPVLVHTVPVSYRAAGLTNSDNGDDCSADDCNSGRGSDNGNSRRGSDMGSRRGHNIHGDMHAYDVCGGRQQRSRVLAVAR